jgi:hypothetical protein
VRERNSGRVIAALDEQSERYKEIELPGFPPVVARLEQGSAEAVFASAVSALAKLGEAESQKLVLELAETYLPAEKLPLLANRNDKANPTAPPKAGKVNRKQNRAALNRKSANRAENSP